LRCIRRNVHGDLAPTVVLEHLGDEFVHAERVFHAWQTDAGD
jgi:hypothetical protein